MRESIGEISSCHLNKQTLKAKMDAEDAMKTTMSKISTTHLHRIQGRLGDIVYEMTKLRFSHFRPAQPWNPSLNAYRCEHCIAICVDLAGMDAAQVSLKVEPQRLLIQGRRGAPEPEGEGCKPIHVLAMEIDSGSFEREVVLAPLNIDTARVTNEYKNGMLWIYLPLSAHA